MVEEEGRVGSRRIALVGQAPGGRRRGGARHRARTARALGRVTGQKSLRPLPKLPPFLLFLLLSLPRVASVGRLRAAACENRAAPAVVVSRPPVSHFS